MDPTSKPFSRIIVVSTSRPLSVHVTNGGKSWELIKAGGSVVDSLHCLQNLLCSEAESGNSGSATTAPSELPNTTPLVASTQNGIAGAAQSEDSALQAEEKVATPFASPAASAPVPSSTPVVSSSNRTVPLLWVGPVPGSGSLPPGLLAAETLKNDLILVPLPPPLLSSLWSSYGVSPLWATLHSLPIASGEEEILALPSGATGTTQGPGSGGASSTGAGGITGGTAGAAGDEGKREGDYAYSAGFPSNDRGFADFYAASVAIADACVSIVRPGDLVVFHDHGTMLVPGILRDKLPAETSRQATFVFLLSLPWPSYESFRCLPEREILLLNMLQADVVCMQDFLHIKNLCDAATQCLAADVNFHRIIHSHHTASRGFRQHRTSLLVMPLGVDLETTKRSIVEDANEFTKLSRTLFPHSPNRDKMKLVLSIDRLDLAKGSVHKLLAFEELLTAFPKWRGLVQYVIVVRDPFTYVKDREGALPSKAPISKISKQHITLLRQIHELVGRINGTYANLEWLPVILLRKSLPRSTMQGLLARADVALMCSLREGITIPAFEYVRAKVTFASAGVNHPSCQGGALIYSETCGAAHVLQGCYIVNPLDPVDVATTLDQALSLDPTESSRRMQKLAAGLRSYDSEHWAKGLHDHLKQVVATKRASPDGPTTESDLVNVPRLLEDVATVRAAGKKTLVIVDGSMIVLDAFDGVLDRAVAPSPGALSVNQHLYSILVNLSNRPDTEVWIVSDDRKERLSVAFPDNDVPIMAENGYFIRRKGHHAWQQQFYDPCIQEAPAGGATPVDIDAWRRGVIAAFQYFTERTPGSLLLLDHAQLRWSWSYADPEFGLRQARDLQVHLESLLFSQPVDVKLNVSKCTVTVRHLGVTGTSACARILSEVTLRGGFESPVGLLIRLQMTPSGIDVTGPMEGGAHLLTYDINVPDGKSTSQIDERRRGCVLPDGKSLEVLLELLAMCDTPTFSNPH